MTEQAGPRTLRPRVALNGADLRSLGVPKTLMSDFEFEGAVLRDHKADGEPFSDGKYDRRGLLNVIAYLLDQQAEAREGLREPCANCGYIVDPDMNALAAAPATPPIDVPRLARAHCIAYHEHRLREIACADSRTEAEALTTAYEKALLP